MVFLENPLVLGTANADGWEWLTFQDIILYLIHTVLAHCGTSAETVVSLPESCSAQAGLLLHDVRLLVRYHIVNLSTFDLKD